MSNKKIEKIIGIDPGLVNTGWGIILKDGNRHTYIDSGTIKTTAKQSIEERLKIIYEGLLFVIEKYKPSVCALEEIFVNKNPMTSLKLGQARGIAIVVPAVLNLKVYEYQNRMIKKTVTGSGKAGKDQIYAMVKMLLPKSKIDSEHSADALAIAITHANMQVYN